MQRPNALEESDDPLLKWVHWVDRAIEAAQERGDFDNLPGRGKPLVIDEHPYAGDRALGFHVLNNAGVKPVWMEVDKEIQVLRARMQRLLDQVFSERVRIEFAPSQPRRPATSGWFKWLVTGERFTEPNSPPHQNWNQHRAVTRLEYLRLAADLDEKLRVYNHALPPGLRHLERIRLSESDAAGTFDAAIPENDRLLSNREDP